MTDFLWYIPNTIEAGHRGDDVRGGWADLDLATSLATLAEQHGWDGALLGSGWDRPDAFTVATALAARTATFRPLVAIRPGYWHPAHFASAAATLDHFSGGRLRINIVSGQDNPAAYGDAVSDSATRYARTGEFMHLVRRLWTEEHVTFYGEHYHVEDSSLALRPASGGHPTLYFGGASAAAERVSAAEADVQLFWGEPLDDIALRISRLKALSADVDRRHLPLGFGLRTTTVVRETSAEAWRAAEARIATMASLADADRAAANPVTDGWQQAVGQQRLAALADRGDVLDSCLYTAPGKFGGLAAGATWLVGSYEEVAAALGKYAALGITHFILSDTPYLQEAAHIGDHLLPLLRPATSETPIS